MTPKDKMRIRNPFRDPLVTELIEDPIYYSDMFSERILVGETLEVFQPTNVILLGPQGSGKSMILNLLRYLVLSEWITKHGSPPVPLKHLSPFLGISINLVRANFHSFGRRSFSKAKLGGVADQALDASCAADFLNNYLFREYLRGIELIISPKGQRLADWLGLDKHRIPLKDIVKKMSSWDCWFGYYIACNTLNELQMKCEQRLNIWRSFLNANIDEVPSKIMKSKSTVGEPLHAMGNLLREIYPQRRRLPLFVVIDQYEVLPELNPSFGTMLQRLVNTLIKARDPVVFYKIGARTYDWGNELRVWGAESRIEVQRDYVTVNLSNVLMRKEDSRGWLFPDFARDVAYRRIKVVGHYSVNKDKIDKIFGGWSPEKESKLYFLKPSRKYVALRFVSDQLKDAIIKLCGPKATPLDLRLAAAWVLQRRGWDVQDGQILKELIIRPWSRPWWKKERIGVALLQIASLANQKKRYFGWETTLYLSGANISAFLLLCGEIWDIATKMDIDPIKQCPLEPLVQTEGIYAASEKWLIRDRNEHLGGRKRYEVLSRLGPAIHDKLIGNLAISNPGHSGFSLREMDLWGGDKGKEVAKYIQNAVSWAIFEERPHTSKLRESASRRKWYLHPLLSPALAIPYIRVKEPFYANINDVYEWFFGKGKIKFGKELLIIDKPAVDIKDQLRLPFEKI